MNTYKIAFGNVETHKSVEIKEGHLIQFKVYAPYDGCHWMYDFAYCLNDGNGLNFSNPLLLGSKFTDRLAEVLNPSADKHYKDTVYLYDLNDPASFKEFYTECNEQNVNQVSTILHEKHGITLKMPCGKCDHETPIFEMMPTSYHGDGGIGIVNTHYICTDCYCVGLCGDCGEYSEDLTYNEKDGADYCEYCMKNHTDEDNTKKIHEDQLTMEGL